jgi:predicted enzyme related to lactoylglutathione lyase
MALLRKVDCIRLYVPDLEAGLAFYRDRLGHELIWRSDTAAGLRLPESDAELVLQTEEQRQEVDLLVDSADEAARWVEQAGGKVIVPPFDIQIGRCVVLEDPWGNPLVLLDMSKGSLKTDADGNVIGDQNLKSAERKTWARFSPRPSSFRYDKNCMVITG